ncbi:YbaK/EbsC family protein [Streptomonospora salina]|uniref:Prolyl-tRNA editing enzyme YbaK/EbsC (Cys-tRNA(Pro) deacylase) n=1 Tax=Streptomonospora salina TaxID=104205 RepID=A0A841E767_9ACTN|nr:YbaK/EbsC family protein [Streptomonospora salina]MBB5998304.1 prolyl-tRNA editing enzyme YbaK/EbsC (Cys-tRNA(Pro) deacylase) [Streptomonospora salina]
MHAKSQRVQDALIEHGEQGRVRELADSTRSAAEAAEALGTTVPRIAKSLVFLVGGEPLLVIASGTNRVDTGLLAKHLGTDAEITRPTAEAVKAATGFSIGGVPPLAHDRPLRTVVDADLLAFDAVWAAAGTPRSVFPIAPDRLVAITGGATAPVC